VAAARVEDGAQPEGLERGEVVAPVGPVEAEEVAVRRVLGEVERDQLDLVRVRVRVGARVRVRVGGRVRVTSRPA